MDVRYRDVNNRLYQNFGFANLQTEAARARVRTGQGRQCLTAATGTREDYFLEKIFSSRKYYLEQFIL